LVAAFACAPPQPATHDKSLPAALQASSPPFHDGEVGLAYTAVALGATGGKAPYTWSISSGALPRGLTLDSSGSVSGNPTSAGAYPFTIQLADAAGGTATLPG
jgi:hypothetical protein